MDSPASVPKRVQQKTDGIFRDESSFISCIIMNRMNLGEAISSYLEREGVSQEKLAKMAKVSQATVSRALHRQALRPGRARTRLFTFMQKQGLMDQPESAIRAVSEVWDGSNAHSAALAKLVQASRDLWPKLGGKEQDDS
jgi:hypothetical protein